jgi:hypothetical protein
MRALLFLAIFAADVRPAEACATAPPRGEEVRVAEEEALIVWDPATKTEHFIRRAAFHSSARAFGFLVPTPAVPQLSEVPDHIFSSMANAIAPEIVYDRSGTKIVPMSLLASCLLMSAGDAKSAAEPDTARAVHVLQTASVAGFDATTVEADSATALTEWLGKNGFEATPALTKWLERYVADKWKITAFVVASGSQDSEQKRYEVSTKAVKMTFQTERPFYPYREPQIEMTVESNAKIVPVSERFLRVFFLSNERYAATLANQPWSANVLHAAPTTYLPAEVTQLSGGNTHLTVFDDPSTPRRGIDELYFAPSADEQVVRQQRVIEEPSEVPIPVDVIVIALGVVGFVVYRRRRRKR